MPRRNTRHVIGNLSKSRSTNVTIATIKQAMRATGGAIVAQRIRQIEDPMLRKQAEQVFRAAWITE